MENWRAISTKSRTSISEVLLQCRQTREVFHSRLRSRRFPRTLRKTLSIELVEQTRLPSVRFCGVLLRLFDVDNDLGLFRAGNIAIDGVVEAEPAAGRIAEAIKAGKVPSAAECVTNLS